MNIKFDLVTRYHMKFKLRWTDRVLSIAELWPLEITDSQKSLILHYRKRTCDLLSVVIYFAFFNSHQFPLRFLEPHTSGSRRQSLSVPIPPWRGRNRRVWGEPTHRDFVRPAVLKLSFFDSVRVRRKQKWRVKREHCQLRSQTTIWTKRFA